MQKTFEIYGLIDEEGSAVVAIGIEAIGPDGRMDITGEKYYARTPALLARQIKDASIDCEGVEIILGKTEHSHPIHVVEYEENRFMWAMPLEYGPRDAFSKEWGRSTERA